MSSRTPRFDGLVRARVPPEVVDALERLVDGADDRALNRIDPVAFATAHGLEPDRVIDGFVHASKLGLFDMSWNLCCPGCGAVLDANKSLKDVRKTEYACAMCVSSYPLVLDELVEVSFTVSPSVRRIAAHEPETLSPWEYVRQLYWSNMLQPTDDEVIRTHREDSILEEEPVPAGEKVILSLQLPAELLIVMDVMTHGAVMLEIGGEPSRERQELTIVFTETSATPAKVALRPGPARMVIENRTTRRIFPIVYRANDALHTFFGRRREFLTAARLLSNQTFRDLYRTDTLDIDQRLKIANLTVLFTDLKSSTEMYERVGDLVAYDLVKKHFRVLGEAVRAHAGAVVKTIGDAVMATFPTPERGVGAALDMRSAMTEFNAVSGREDLMVKIGLHAGPCLAVMLNERLDYFGQTVNIAARVQGLADAQSIFTTEPVVSSSKVAALLDARGLSPAPRRATLRGIAEELTVFEIP